mgnify:CR=1 FL=1|jgi:sigma-E factor negative regulatory protein RseA
MDVDSKIRSEVSSLLDDELDANHRQILLTALHSDTNLRTVWSDYHLIGDALRRSPDLQADLTGRVMDALREEPTVLAPRVRPERIRYAAALAASLAGVAVVGWLALQPMQPTLWLPQHASLAAVSAARPAPVVVAAVSIANAGRMQEYLLAHQAYSPINRLDGGAGYVRTVSASR